MIVDALPMITAPPRIGPGVPYVRYKYIPGASAMPIPLGVMDIRVASAVRHHAAASTNIDELNPNPLKIIHIRRKSRKVANREYPKTTAYLF